MGLGLGLGLVVARLPGAGPAVRMWTMGRAGSMRMSMAVAVLDLAALKAGRTLGTLTSGRHRSVPPWFSPLPPRYGCLIGSDYWNFHGRKRHLFYPEPTIFDGSNEKSRPVTNFGPPPSLASGRSSRPTSGHSRQASFRQYLGIRNTTNICLRLRSPLFLGHAQS